MSGDLVRKMFLVLRLALSFGTDPEIVDRAELLLMDLVLRSLKRLDEQIK